MEKQRGIRIVAPPPFTRADAQRLAEGFTGRVQWDDGGRRGKARCIGKALHSGNSSELDMDVVVESIDGLAPGFYCFHQKCAGTLAECNLQYRRALARRETREAGVETGRLIPAFALPPKKRGVFDPTLLARLIRGRSVTRETLKAASPVPVEGMSPAGFLAHLYKPEEKVIVFDVYNSQGQAVWDGTTSGDDALDRFKTGCPNGVWFLAAPVTGGYIENRKKADGSSHRSRRTGKTVTSFRWLVLESDEVPENDWLAAVTALPLPIAAIYTSGAKSVHALVNVAATCENHWNRIADEIRHIPVSLGADPAAITAVRLTRLPGCMRHGKLDKNGVHLPFGKAQLQELLYLNPKPESSPICQTKHPKTHNRWTRRNSKNGSTN